MNSKENILYENPDVKLVMSEIDYEHDQIAVEFLFKIVKYDDESTIHKIICERGHSQLCNQFLTPFKLETTSEIVLQRIFMLHGEISSEIIKLDKLTGKINSIQTVGVYELVDFDLNTNVVTGYNLESRKEFFLNLK